MYSYRGRGRGRRNPGGGGDEIDDESYDDNYDNYDNYDDEHDDKYTAIENLIRDMKDDFNKYIQRGGGASPRKNERKDDLALPAPPSKNNTPKKSEIDDSKSPYPIVNRD